MKFPSHLPLWQIGIGFFLLAFGCEMAPARVWRTVTGQSFEAEFVHVEGASGIFRVKEKNYPYPLNRLSIGDRLFIGRILNQQPAPGTTATETPQPASARQSPPVAGGLELAGQRLNPGGEVEIEIPLTDPADVREVNKAYGKPSDKARLLIAVPTDFAPGARPCPLLIVSATADGASSSIGAAHQFVHATLAKGFAVLAVDGQFGKPPDGGSVDFRWALVSAALDALDQQWPQAKGWPIATAGVSGGAGYASHHAIKLAEEQANLIGIFLAVSSWNPARFPGELQKAPFSALRDVPIFLSAGESDQRSTKALTDKSHQSLVEKGFTKVRFEHFAGGNRLDQALLEAALDWFLAEMRKRP